VNSPLHGRIGRLPVKRVEKGVVETGDRETDARVSRGTRQRACHEATVTHLRASGGVESQIGKTAKSLARGVLAIGTDVGQKRSLNAIVLTSGMCVAVVEPERKRASYGVCRDRMSRL